MPTRFICPVLAWPLVLSLLTAQAPPPSVTIRTTTKLVEVNVVVYDKSGQPVTGLKKEDFQLTDNGKLQEIRLFAEFRGGRPASSGPALPPNVFSNNLSSKGDLPASVTAILIDSLNTDWADQAYARQQLVKFLKQLQPQDRVAIYSLGRGLKVLHDYTTDSAALIEQLKQFRGNTLPNLAGSQVSTDALRLDELFGTDQTNTVISAGERFFFTNDRVLRTTAALEAIGRHLAAVPGRRSLIWLSAGFPPLFGFDQASPTASSDSRFATSYWQDILRTTKTLSDSGVAVYPVDARGLFTDPAFSASNPATGSMMSRSGTGSAPLNAMTQTHQTMRAIAERTGGRAFLNTNDLTGAIRSAVHDGEVSYTLGFYAELAGQKDRFHKLKVKVTSGKYEIRHRDGYYPVKPLEADDKRAKQELERSVWSPLEATAVAMNARVDPMPGKPDELSVIVQIDPLNLYLTEDGDRRKGHVDIVFFQRDEQGNSFGGIQEAMTLNLTPQTYQQLTQKGLLYHRTLPRSAKASTLIIAVRDSNSGAIGTLRVPLGKVQEQPTQP